MGLLGTVGARAHDHGRERRRARPATVRDRLTAVGLSDEQIERRMATGRIRASEPVNLFEAPSSGIY
jgi:hypothetical protein